MLSLKDLNLMDQCSKGELILLIAPGKEFENGTQRIMIESSEITIIKFMEKSTKR